VVSAIADEVFVLERGHVRESGKVDDVLGRPTHQYTQDLLASAPSISQAMTAVGER
jgi:ABC-type glutathione transport system ATPase component